jgi:hypothetical protein
VLPGEFAMFSLTMRIFLDLDQAKIFGFSPRGLVFRLGRGQQMDS